MNSKAKLILFFLFLGCLFIEIVSQNYQDDNMLEGHLSIILEDNLGDRDGAPISQDVWSKRSVINVRNVKLGQAYASESRQWTMPFINRLKELASKKGFYKLRLRQSTKPDAFINTFTDACLFYNAAASESLSLLIDSSPQLGGISSELISASLLTPFAAQCSDLTEQEEADIDSRIMEGTNTSLTIKTASSPVQPDTTTYIQRLEMQNKEKMENKDNRSFLAKYWMYIIPFVLIVLISGGGEQGGGR